MAKKQVPLPKLRSQAGGGAKEGRPPELGDLSGKSFEFYLRELLQNAMDACIGQEGPCIVRIAMMSEA